MINLLPRDVIFFDLFEHLAKHAVTASEHLRTLVQKFPDIHVEVQAIRDEEHAADEITHQALERLDRTFITPFDREDIHALVGELDSIVDNINDLAKRVGLYHIKSIEPLFLKQADVLVQAATALAAAVAGLRKSRKLADLSGKFVEIHRLENMGDDNHLNAISRLFEGNPDPLHVIRWKEFYEYIEAAIDGCEDVTNVLERIVLKNG